MSTTLFLDDKDTMLLREIIENVRTTPRYIAFVLDLLQRLPESSASPVGCADSSPAAVRQEPTAGKLPWMSDAPWRAVH